MNVDSMRCRTENGTLLCLLEENGVCIAGCEEAGDFLDIPETIEGAAVCGIGRKAFLGNRSLQHIILPKTIEWIGDWAFGSCAKLQRVEFPCRPIRLGKGIFAKDQRLYEISLKSREGKPILPARLPAVAVAMLDAEYLLNAAQMGIAEWYGHFDNRLLTLLMEPIENALKDLVYCAEEDMGAKQEAYLAGQECRKAYMALLRLAYPDMLEEDTAEKLKAYLVDDEGLQTEVAWETIKRAEGKEQLLFCDIMLRSNGIREENLTPVLEDLGDAFVELKAHLLKGWEGRKAKISVSERFML